MKCLLRALKAVQDKVTLQSNDVSVHSENLSSSELGSLYSANETITTPRLAAQLCSNNGVYLNLLDEIEGLFESLDGKTREHLDRRLWLSLNTGAPVTRSTTNKVITVDETRLNYTGELKS